MHPAMLPTNERDRVAALRDLDILDTPAEPVFDSFVRVAREVAQTPIAGVSLVAEDRQWFKAVVGMPRRTGTPRDLAFCAHTIMDPDKVLYIPDLGQDPRFNQNPHVIGDPRYRFYAGAPLIDEHGHALGALCVIDHKAREVTAEVLACLADLACGVSAALRLHRAVRQLDSQAHRDHLTDLLNRRAFEARLAEPVSPAGTTLFLVDLDRFKEVNDTLGHLAGDAALSETAARLTRATQGQSRVYRLGGDEFAILHPRRLMDHEAVALGARLQAALAEPFTIEGIVLPLRASIGVAVTSSILHDQTTSLVSHADDALYQAKAAGRGCTRLYRNDTSGSYAAWSIEGLERMDLETRLRRALLPCGAEPFSLVYQPVVDLRTGKVSSLEALVRWLGGPGPMVSPGEFVPLAERTGLAPHLDRWVLRAACVEAATWTQGWPVGVNISAASFSLIDVPALVEQYLVEAKLPPDRLIIELTETALAADQDRLEQAISQLRSIGVGVALDDFGGGHASLLALRRASFTKLKLDRSLVSTLNVDAVGARIAAFVAELGGLLTMTIVAEGIESASELQGVQDAGITHAQGYFFSRPVPAKDILIAVAAAEAAAGSGGAPTSA